MHVDLNNDEIVKLIQLLHADVCAECERQPKGNYKATWSDLLMKLNHVREKGEA